MFKFKDILAIILGAGIFSFGIYFLVIPFHFYEGGATGITLITYYLFKIPVSIMNLLINIPLFILAWKPRKSPVSSGKEISCPAVSKPE